MCVCVCVGQDSSVGIATRYGWTVLEMNPGGSEIFRTRQDRFLGPNSLLYNGYPVFLKGKAVGSWRCPPTAIKRRG